MPPTLFQISLLGHDLGLSTYGAFLALAFSAGLSLVVLGGQRAGLAAPRCVALGAWSAVAGILAARLGALCWPAAAHASPAPLAFLPGLAGAALGATLYARHVGTAPRALLELLAPAVAAAQAVAALGCLAAGCCFGVAATPGDPAVRFGPGTVAFQALSEHGEIPFSAHATPALVPVQLVEATLWAVVAALAWHLGGRRALAALLVAQGAVPTLLEPLRATSSGAPGPLGAAILVLVGVSVMLRTHVATDAPPAPGDPDPRRGLHG